VRAVAPPALRRKDVGVMRRHARYPTLLAAATALVLAGCGGGSTASGPTRAQFIASANAVCAAAHSQTASLITKVKSSGASALLGGDTKSLAGLVAQLHDAAASNLAKLRALPQPAGDHAAIAGFMKPLSNVVNDIGQAATDLSKGEALNAFALIQQAQPEAAKVTTAANAYGAKKCGTVLAALS
jgi:hypothetical protein